MAPTVIEQLGPHKYYLEAPCGSMAVLLSKDRSPNETVVDLHGGLTNLAKVVQDAELAVELYERLIRTLYSDALFNDTRKWLDEFSESDELSVDWAYHYFVASWMGRNGVSGTKRVNYQQATRWTSKGGSGPTRFRSAVESIPDWHDRLRNVVILRKDLFDVLGKVEDADDVAIYCDPPYLPETMSGSSRYLHDFSESDHARLAESLRRFDRARVVLSYYYSPKLAGLYPGWNNIDCSRQKHLHVQNKRGMGRKDAPEVLLVNGDVYECASKEDAGREAAASLFGEE